MPAATRCWVQIQADRDSAVGAIENSQEKLPDANFKTRKRMIGVERTQFVSFHFCLHSLVFRLFLFCFEAF